MTLYVTPQYMTARESDALAEQDGWPTFGVPTSVGPIFGRAVRKSSSADCQSAQAGSLRYISYTRSTSKAMPIPPLIQSVASPRFDRRFFISCSNVVVMRTPVQPIG